MRKKNTQEAGAPAVTVQRIVKRRPKRCNWMMQSKDWKECGRKATRYARGIGAYYCTEHASRVIGWRYQMEPLNGGTDTRRKQ